MEAIIATVITVIAVLAMAYSFSLGRSFINAFEVRRVADARAQGCMEWLSSLHSNDPNLSAGTHPGVPQPFVVNRVTIGGVRWRVGPTTDVPPTVAGVLRNVTVSVTWSLGGFQDSVVYSRLVAAP